MVGGDVLLIGIVLQVEELVSVIEPKLLIAGTHFPGPVLERHAIWCRVTFAKEPQCHADAIEWLIADALHTREIDER